MLALARFAAAAAVVVVVVAGCASATVDSPDARADAATAATVPSITGGDLTVRTEGCGGSGTVDGPDEPRAEWLDDGRVAMTTRMHFSTRVHLPDAARVDVDVRGPFVVAWIPTLVEDAGGGPVDTCLYAALLRLELRGLPRGDYEWILREGHRASDTEYETAIARALAERAANAGRAGEPDASGAPDAEVAD